MFTITTPASDTSLLTADEVRAALPNAVLTATQVAQLRARVSSAITRACRVPAAGAVTPTLRLEVMEETFRLKSHQSALVLSRRPIVDITSITENATALVESTDFEVDPTAGMVKRLSGDYETCWPCGKIVIAYSAGWETVPQDLKEAAQRLVRDYWTAGLRTDPNLKRESIPGVIEREWWVGDGADPAVPQEIMEILSPYRHFVVA